MRSISGGQSMLSQGGHRDTARGREAIYTATYVKIAMYRNETAMLIYLRGLSHI